MKAQDPNRNDEAIFREQRTRLVVQRCSLLKHQFACVSKCLSILQLRDFYRNKVNARSKYSLVNYQRTLGIILLIADESFHFLYGDDSNAVAS